LSQIAFYTMTIGQEIQNRRNRLQRPQTTPIQVGSRLRTKRSSNTQ